MSRLVKLYLGQVVHLYELLLALGLKVSREKIAVGSVLKKDTNGMIVFVG